MNVNRNLFKQYIKKYALFFAIFISIPSYKTPILLLNDSSYNYYLFSPITPPRSIGRIINEVIAK